MAENDEDARQLPTRRDIVVGALWTVPAVALTATSPAQAMSPTGIAFTSASYSTPLEQSTLVELAPVDQAGDTIPVALSYGGGISGPPSVILAGASVSFFVRSTAVGTGWIVATSGLGTASVAVVSISPTFADLRFRWQSMIVGESLHAQQFDPNVLASARAGIVRSASSASAWVRSMDLSGPALWSDLPLGTNSGNLTATAQRLESIGISLHTAGSSLKGDAGVEAQLARGLVRFVDIAYTPTATEYGNWWDWQSGAARPLVSAAVFAYASLASTDTQKIVRSILAHVSESRIASATGANLSDMTTSRALAGVLTGDDSLTRTAMDSLSSVLKPVASGDGFYSDGSFVQHGYVPYTGAYGADVLRGLSLMSTLFAGTPSAFAPDDLLRLATHVDLAYLPAVVARIVPDALSGRMVSRQGRSDWTRAREIIVPLVRTANVVGEPYRSRWRARAAAFFDGSFGNPPSSAEQTMYSLTYDVVRDTNRDVAPEQTSHSFTMMSRTILHANGWGAIIAMSSRRTTFYEFGNDENRKGYHTGIGMVAWWANDGTAASQFADAYWPTAAPDAHPGITVSGKPLQDGYGGAWANWRPATRWAGGATSKAASAIGTVVRPLGSTLTARKSWFLCEDVLVCLGSGISSTDGYPVSTIIDNRNTGAAGGREIIVDGQVLSMPLGIVQSPDAPRWIHIEGSGGYIPLGAEPVRVLRENRTGRWSDISGSGSSASMTRQYIRLFIDHGRDPSSATYAYAMMPTASPQVTGLFAEDVADRVTLLRQDESVHAVHFMTAGILLANFWSPSSTSVGGITVSQPIAVLFDSSAHSWLAVSDAQATLDSVEVSIEGASGYEGQDTRVQVLDGDGPLRLRIDLAQSQGATIVIPLRGG